MDTVALKKAALEMLRLVALAIIPILIIQLTDWSFDYRALFVAGVIAALRFIDKYLHEKGKESGSEMLTKGLTRF